FLAWQFTGLISPAPFRHLVCSKRPTMSLPSASLVPPARGRGESVAQALAPSYQPEAESVLSGVRRRLEREQRRRKVGRAYDMSLEIARIIPSGSEVLDVGCGNGFIAHHLSATLGTPVTGI